MTKAILFWLLATVLLATVLPAEAQQPTKVPRIGFLSATSLSTNRARIEAFRDGLRELGYVEGKNIVIEYRFAEGRLDRLRELAAELVRLKVDVIVTAGHRDYDDRRSLLFRRKKTDRRAFRQIPAASYLLPEGVCR